MADSVSNENESAVAPDTQIDHTTSLAYWSSVAPNENGMLGGYGSLSRIDLQSSANFIAKIRRRSSVFPAGKQLLPRAVDCGAGIGRITQGLLAKVCDVVDLVEPVAQFVTSKSGEKITSINPT